MESSVSSGGRWENDTLLVVPPSEKSTHLTEGSIAGIVLGCTAAVVAFSKLQCRFCLRNHLTLSGYHADTPITIKAEASSKADSRPN